MHKTGTRHREYLCFVIEVLSNDDVFSGNGGGRLTALSQADKMYSHGYTVLRTKVNVWPDFLDSTAFPSEKGGSERRDETDMVAAGARNDTHPRLDVDPP